VIAAQALEFLQTLGENYLRVAKRVDFERIPSDLRDEHARRKTPARPLIQAAWFARQGFIISAWSLWEYYARNLCSRLSAKVPKGGGSCVDQIGRMLAGNSVPFPRADWFAGANALRNIIAHYGGLVDERKAGEYFAAARRVAFPLLELYADKYLLLQHEHVSAFRWEIEDFIDQTAAAVA